MLGFGLRTIMTPTNRPSIRLHRREFADFIEDPEPQGLGTTVDAIRKFLGDSTNPLRIKLERLVKTDAGPPLGNRNGPNGRAGKPKQEPIPDIIRDWLTPEPDAPNPPPPPPPRKRDRSGEPETGTSIGYTVRRLERDAVKDPAVRPQGRYSVGVAGPLLVARRQCRL
jgi:hypothetical protein